MEIDRKFAAELGVSVVSVAVFVGAAYFVSQSYAAPTPGNVTGNSSVSPVLQPDGGVAMIGVIVLFVLLMAVVGFFMYRADFDEE